MTRICLNMIVKNEAARIERCLASVAPFISSYAILDTGSTDDTKARIRDFFGSLNIPGLIGSVSFEDFATTRNAALRHAAWTAEQTNLGYDYLLLVDADMELVVPDRLLELTAPAHMIEQRAGDLRYWNTRLLHRDVAAQYRGVTHEYLDTGSIKPEKLFDAYFIDHADGANRPGKFERDIALLEKAVATDPSDARSWFYLGQSYKDAGRFGDAFAAYQERERLGGWDEESFFSQLSMARCQNASGKPWIDDALQAFERRPSRAEPLADLAKHYRERGMNETALMFARRAMVIPPSDDLLFVEKAQESARETLAICAFYSKDPAVRDDGHDVCNSLALDRKASSA